MQLAWALLSIPAVLITAALLVFALINHGCSSCRSKHRAEDTVYWSVVRSPPREHDPVAHRPRSSRDRFLSDDDEDHMEYLSVRRCRPLANEPRQTFFDGNSFIGKRTVERCLDALQHSETQISPPRAVERMRRLCDLAKSVFTGTTTGERWNWLTDIARLQTTIAAAISINGMLDAMDSGPYGRSDWEERLVTEVATAIELYSKMLDHAFSIAVAMPKETTLDSRQRQQLALLLYHELEDQEHGVALMFRGVVTLMRRALTFVAEIGNLIIPVTQPVWMDPCVLLRKNPSWKLGLIDVGVSVLTVDSHFAEEVCIRKAALWCSLSHPNVVKLQAACLSDTPRFVHEHGQDIVGFLQSVPAPKLAFTRLYEASLGLQFLHNRDIVLSELTTSDLLVITTSRARSSNDHFVGKINAIHAVPLTSQHPPLIASSASEKSKLWQWTAPERRSGAAASKPADIFAFGMCVLHVLTGQEPYAREKTKAVEVVEAGRSWCCCGSDLSNSNEAAEDAGDQCSRHQESTMELPRTIQSLGGEARELVQRMCAFDPRARVSILYVIEQLRRLSESELSLMSSRGGKYVVEVSPKRLQSSNVSSLFALLPRIIYTMDLIRQHWSTCGTAQCGPVSAIAVFDSVIVRIDCLITSFTKAVPSQIPAAATKSLLGIVQRLEQVLSSSGSVTRASTASLSWSSSSLSSLVSSRKALSTCHSLHKDLDCLLTSVDPIHASDRVHSDWRVRWNTFKVVESSCRMSPSSLVSNNLSTDGSDWIIQVEANTQTEGAAREHLTVLQFELAHHASSYSDSSLTHIKAAIDVLERRFGTNQLPPWFIPSYEVDFSELDAFAAGSFGSIHRGRWLDTDVVIKKVFASGTAETDEAYQLNFEREADIWSALSHENVVQLYGACHLRGQHFFVCEFAPLCTLDTFLRVRREQKFQHPGDNEINVWQLLYGVGCGLAYLHDNGIAHGDLKCNNVLIGGDETPKLTDFGLSKIPSNATDDEDLVGALGAYRWKAPEVLRGEVNATLTADVFSFGMLIVEAVTGEIPWGGALPDAVVKVHVKAGRLPSRSARTFGLNNLSGMGEVLNDEQWDLVEAMCRYDPDDRMKLHDANSRILRLSLEAK